VRPIAGIDVFQFYRRFLWLVLTIYWVAIVVGSAARHLAWIRSDRYGRITGKYLVVQVLRIRLRRHWKDLAQCLGLVVLFLVLWAMHSLVPGR